MNSHSRMISPEFLEALDTGILSGLTVLLRSSQVGARALLPAFRGTYFNVYYCGHSLYKIEEQENGYKLTFNFNHARYTADYEGKLASACHNVRRRKSPSFSCPPKRRILQTTS